MTKKIVIHTGILIDKNSTYSLHELCRICGVHAERVIEMVEYGILNPEGKSPARWQFTSKELNTLKKALRLQHDLEINLPGVAMTIELLEELETLRQELDKLEQQFDKWFK